jgi:hypothetical protein
MCVSPSPVPLKNLKVSAAGHFWSLGPNILLMLVNS